MTHIQSKNGTSSLPAPAGARWRPSRQEAGTRQASRPQAGALARLQRESAKLQAKLARADLTPAPTAGAVSSTPTSALAGGARRKVAGAAPKGLPIPDVPEVK